MQKKPKRFRNAVIGCFVLIFFYLAFIGTGAMGDNFSEESLKSAEESIKRAAVQCYATEGSYPPDIQYLVEHYGLIINEKDYFYHYEVIASNIIPNIKVIRR